MVVGWVCKDVEFDLRDGLNEEQKPKVVRGGPPQISIQALEWSDRLLSGSLSAVPSMDDEWTDREFSPTMHGQTSGNRGKSKPAK